MPPAEAGLRHHRARRHMADRDERDRHQQEEEAGIGDDPPLQAEPGDQQLRRGGGGESEDERDLREPVAHPVKKRAVGGRADERRSPSELRLIVDAVARINERSAEHTSELQSLMRTYYAVFCSKKKLTSIT